MFFDTKIKLGALGNVDKRPIHKLRTQLLDEGVVGSPEGLEMVNEVGWLASYLTKKYQEWYTDDEKMQVEISSGVTIAEFDDADGNQVIDRDEWSMWTAESRSSYSLPGFLVRDYDFWEYYLQNIKEERGHLQDLLSVPMGLFAERVIDRVLRIEEAAIQSGSQPDDRLVTFHLHDNSKDDIAPEELIRMTALGVTPSSLETVIDMMVGNGGSSVVTKRASRRA